MPANSIKSNSMEKRQVLAMLKAIDENLTSKQEICIIGSSVLILLDMPLRRTMDLDLWDVNEPDRVKSLKQAVEKSGFLFDPNDYMHLEEPYVQMVQKDFVHMPNNEDWQQNKELLWSGTNLTIYRPPLEVIATSKLASGREADFHDVVFLFSIDNELTNKITKMSKFFNEEEQENIVSNLVLIDLLQKENQPKKPNLGKL